MNAIKTLAAAAMTVLVAGCSTPVAVESALTPKAPRILKPELVVPASAPAAGAAKVFVVRDLNYTGVGCPYDIFINDELTLQLYVSEGVHLLLPPGRTRFRMEMGGLVCPSYQTAAEVELKAGDSVAVRTGLDHNRPYLRVEK